VVPIVFTMMFANLDRSGELQNARCLFGLLASKLDSWRFDLLVDSAVGAKSQYLLACLSNSDSLWVPYANASLVSLMPTESAIEYCEKCRQRPEKWYSAVSGLVCHHTDKVSQYICQICVGDELYLRWLCYVRCNGEGSSAALKSAISDYWSRERVWGINLSGEILGEVARKYVDSFLVRVITSLPLRP
jgi:hypothetical protein